MSTDADHAEALAWKAYAEACCEHDPVHGRHACAELARLVPRPRPVEEPLTAPKG